MCCKQLFAHFFLRRRQTPRTWFLFTCWSNSFFIWKEHIIIYNLCCRYNQILCACHYPYACINPLELHFLTLCLLLSLPNIRDVSRPMDGGVCCYPQVSCMSASICHVGLTGRAEVRSKCLRSVRSSKADFPEVVEACKYFRTCN